MRAALKSNFDVVAVDNQKVFHKLEVCKAVVGLVVKELQVLLADNGFHWERNCSGALEGTFSGERGWV